MELLLEPVDCRETSCGVAAGASGSARQCRSPCGNAGDPRKCLRIRRILTPNWLIWRIRDLKGMACRFRPALGRCLSSWMPIRARGLFLMHQMLRRHPLELPWQSRAVGLSSARSHHGRQLMRTAWIFQFPLDPAKRLLGEGLHIFTSTVLHQLGNKGGGKQFGSATVGVAFEFVPVAIANAQVLVKIPWLVRWPVRASSSATRDDLKRVVSLS